MENLEHEQILLKMLGLKIVETDSPNVLNVTTRNGKEVGSIKRKKIHNRKVRKGTFGYQTEIETEQVHYSFTRVSEDDFKEKCFKKDNRFFYAFDIKKDNKKNHYVELNLGLNPSLAIWSEEYGFVNFSINNDKMYVNFRSETESFKVEESIEVRMNNEVLHPFGERYSYQLDFCSKGESLENKNSKVTYLISVDIINEKEISICEQTWRKNKLIKNKVTNVEGTISEAITKHKDGIAAFNRFRYFINELLPCRKEIIGVMLEKRGITEYPFMLFMPEYMGIDVKNDKTKILK